ncbi:hypothetical protein CKAH01_06747 [Colletotrichum kahawae]|uniref:Uncharacterized protein n=1 Tax=Colletotrichum kahawae TaxID=34407 RepID=A0AAD9Y954_COLKA|nr:hypothetical protein CKAH01_06747 [Colletotrichum kahawae]
MVGNRVDKSTCWSTPTRKRDPEKVTWRPGKRIRSIKVSPGEMVALGKQIEGLRLVGLTPCCCHPVPSLPPSYAYACDCDYKYYGGGTVIVWARAAKPFRPPDGASFQPIRLLLQRDHHYETANGMQ